MEFALTEDQVMFQDSVAAFLADASPLDRVREVAAGDMALAAEMTGGLQALGAGQILVPEAYDGLGLGLLDAALVQEALGAAVAPAGYLAGAMAAVGISSAGDETQKAEWLGALANGNMRIGVAVAEQVGAREGAGVKAGAGTVSGRSLFALETANALGNLVM